MARGPLTDVFSILQPVAIYGGLGYLVLHKGPDGTSLLDRITRGVGEGIGSGILPGSASSSVDPTQGPANFAGGNAFQITNVSTFRHFDGLWYVDGDIQHQGGGGTFVAQLELREAGAFGLGAGQYQVAGTFTFDVPQEDNLTPHHISSDQGMGGPTTFLGTDARLTIKGLSGEVYTQRQISADQGGF